jgi:ParB family chromosome partitioning protein
MTALTPVTLKPDQIRIEANIRRDVKVDKPFWSSIKQDGILIPIVVEQLDDGAYRVVDGQRRTLAAIDGGVTEIPAVVVDGLKDDATRVMRQLIVNDQREPITDVDRMAAWQSLFDLEVSADAIARKTKAPKARIEAAKKVSGSDLARALVVDEAMPLDVAAELVEFEDDPALVERLTDSWRRWPAGIAHDLARARDARVSEAMRAEVAEQLRALGYTVLDGSPTWTDKNAGIYVDADEVYTDEKLTKRAFSDDAIAKGLPADTPGLVYEVRRHWTDGDFSFAGAAVIHRPLEHGYHLHTTGSTPSPAEHVDDEAAKEERRRVLANNKSWPIATEVRRTWIGHLLQRKTLPAGVDLFAANAIAKQHVWAYGDEHLDAAVTLLDLKSPGSYASPSQTLRHHLTQNPTLAPRVVLAAAIARTEGELNAKDSWRHNSQAGLARYLTALAAWGYGLSELEQQIVDANKAATK